MRTRLRPAKAARALGAGIKKRFLATRERLAKGPHHSFRRTPQVRKKPFNPQKSAKEAWRLIIESLQLIFSHKRIFLWLIILYTLITYLLVGGIVLADYNALKQEAVDYTDGLDAITTALAYFGAAVSGGLISLPSELQQFLTGSLTLIFWLVTIWAARMLLAGKNIKLRDAFYSGPTPIISSLFVLAVIALQLAPAAAGLFAFTIGLSEGWITNLAVALAYGSATVLLCVLSLYWLSSSLVAIAIVALPGTYPMQAIRDARLLVAGNRWNLIARLITSLFLLLVIWAIILVPIFLLDNWLRLEWLPLVPLVVQVVIGVSIVLTSVYIYKLYRSIL